MKSKKVVISLLACVCLVSSTFLTSCGVPSSGMNGEAKAANDQTLVGTVGLPVETPDLEEAAEEPAEEEPARTAQDPKLAKKPKVESFSFTASGDNLIHSCLYEQAAARGKKVGQKYDFDYCYKDVKAFFQMNDLNWINQETLVNNGYTPSGYPTFSTPTQVVKDLRECNVTVFNTSSNHSYDKSAGGLSSAMSFWDKMAQKKEGKDCYQVGIVKRSSPLPQLIRKVGGVKVGFLSYTYGTNGITIDSGSTYRVVYLDEIERIEKQVKALRSKVDVVMVSCHWGVENSHSISGSQRSLAKKLISWGTDVIIGTHPHVLQNCGWIKAGGRKGFCAYSLGNFISGQVQNDQILGGTLTCTIKVNHENGNVAIKNPMIKPSVTVYGNDRSNIHVKWLSDYTSTDAGIQSSHLSKATFTNMAKKYVSAKYLDM